MQLPAAVPSTAASKQHEPDMKISTTTAQLSSKSKILPFSAQVFVSREMVAT